MSSKETHRSGQIANRLDGKVALITGGSTGIGTAIALRFAAEGARVVISYKRNRAAAEAVVAKLTEQGGDGIAIRADVTSEAETHALIRETTKLGKIDVLVNNAALFARVPIEAVDMELAAKPALSLRNHRLATTAWLHRTLVEGTSSGLPLQGLSVVAGPDPQS